MPSKKPKWAKALTKKELDHLAAWSSTGKPSLRSLKVNLEAQKKNGIECRDCRDIAHKINRPEINILL